MGVIVISVGVDGAARPSYDESDIFRAVTGEREIATIIDVSRVENDIVFALSGFLR
jgi:hypothetical protein